jgi:hypothetical protein
MSRVRVALLNAADWVVPDLEDAGGRLVELLPELRTTGLSRIPEHDFDSVFLRGTADHAAAPTRFQLVRLPDAPSGPADGCAWAPFQPMQDLQGRDRDQRIHGTVLAVHDFDDAVAGLLERGIAVHVEHECAHLPYRRAWLGWSGRDRVEGVDGGLFVEFIPIEVFPRAVRESVTQPVAGPEPSLRVAGRLHLVESLDAAVAQLTELVGLGEPQPYEDEPLGVSAARWTFGHPGSAVLEVAEPAGAGPAADYLAAQGVGPWLTTLECADPTGLARAAERNGARVIRLTDDRILVIDPTMGARLELRKGATT